ncbi:hypothetical protein BHM03_00013021 [Ensete ventricosum]|nr:hypothetical protein BHM03_00013021 [Ensete ventricosum]
MPHPRPRRRSSPRSSSFATSTATRRASGGTPSYVPKSRWPSTTAGREVGSLQGKVSRDGHRGERGGSFGASLGCTASPATFSTRRATSRGAAYAGKPVLVVGCGNSGMEIAYDLSEFGVYVMKVSYRITKDSHGKVFLRMGKGRMESSLQDSPKWMH